MGLDMYFYARHSTWKSYGRWRQKDGEQDKTNYPEALKTFEDYIFDWNFKSYDMEERWQIGYFRKFNALHSFIVKHYADGEDNCRPISLTKESAKEIHHALADVLAHRENAKYSLPTSSGFFFGSTEYDEEYFEDVANGLKLFDMIMADFDFDKFDLVYEASW